jgi:hypothetical protein
VSGSRRPGGSGRVLARVSRAVWRLERAERERTWALVSARAEGISMPEVQPRACRPVGPRLFLVVSRKRVQPGGYRWPEMTTTGHAA